MSVCLLLDVYDYKSHFDYHNHLSQKQYDIVYQIHVYVLVMYNGDTLQGVAHLRDITYKDHVIDRLRLCCTIKDWDTYFYPSLRRPVALT